MHFSFQVECRTLVLTASQRFEHRVRALIGGRRPRSRRSILSLMGLTMQVTCGTVVGIISIKEPRITRKMPPSSGAFSVEGWWHNEDKWKLLDFGKAEAYRGKIWMSKSRLCTPLELRSLVYPLWRIIELTRSLCHSRISTSSFSGLLSGCSTSLGEPSNWL